MRYRSFFTILLQQSKDCIVLFAPGGGPEFGKFGFDVAAFGKFSRGKFRTLGEVDRIAALRKHQTHGADNAVFPAQFAFKVAGDAVDSIFEELRIKRLYSLVSLLS